MGLYLWDLNVLWRESRIAGQSGMKDLGKWQVISLISRFLALFIGLVQSVIVTRILTISEFGLVGIVGSVGALFGIAQHLGLASGTTREISAGEGGDNAFKIFISSFVIKYVITIPIAILLFFLAPYLATKIYEYPQIILPLRLYSVVLIIQGVQSIFNSVIAGLRRFKSLFLYQTLIAFVSLIFYIPLVHYYKVNGYFLALVLFNLVSSITLAVLALWPLRRMLKLPIKQEFFAISKNLLYLSLSIYFVKVLYTVWFKFGQATLGYFETLEAVGIFSFAILYSSKLLTISDALTDVNLPVFSKEFVSNFDNFKKLFRENFNKLYVFILYSGLAASFWARELVNLFIGNKYDSSIPIILPLVLSFALYSFVNLIKSSVLIPAKMIYSMIAGYLLMIVTTVGFFLALKSNFNSLDSMAFAMFFGSLSGFIGLAALIKTKLKFYIFDTSLLLITFYLMLFIPATFLLKAFLVKSFFFAFISVILLFDVNRLKIFDFSKILKR